MCPLPCNLKGAINLEHNPTERAEWAVPAFAGVSNSLQRPEPQKPDLLEDMPLAMAYVRMQRWGQKYDPDLALQRGTLFPDLDFPFEGKGACLRDE